MSDYSSNFPQQRPTFAFDAKAGKLDSRLSYSRSSGGTFMSSEKALSSENLLLQSQDFNTTWVPSSIPTPTGSQTSPTGDSTAWLFSVVSGATVRAGIYQNWTPVANTEYTLITHLKAGTASHGYASMRTNSGDFYAGAVVDFSAGTISVTSAGMTSATGTVTALGSNWFRVTVTATSGTSLSSPQITIGVSDGTAVGTNGRPAWTAAGTETMYAWGAQLSSTNSKVYDSPTTTQISRSYSPLLKTASADEPRFEFASDGQSVGTALGLLVESQSSNLLTYSEDWTNSDFTKFVAITSNAGIAPTGELSADLVAATSSTGDHLTRQSLTIVSGQTFTMSVFAKASGCNFVRIGGASTAAMPAQASFDLANGTVGTVDYGTAQIEDVGNGYYRCSVTGTAASSSSTHFQVRLMQSDNTPSWTGDDFSGVLLFGQMAEQSSSVSSYIKTTSSSVSRAADSCSVPTADFGFTGGQVSIVAETEAGAGAGNNPRLFNLNDGSDTTRLMLYKNSTSADNTVAWDAYYGASGMGTLAGSNNSSKVAVSVDTNDFAADSDTGTLLTNASGSQHSFSHLYIGSNYNGTAHHLNGHIKRLSLFSVALSDTELAALTS